MTRLHLGHHFYGAGNFGDDLMLAGFVGEAVRHFGRGNIAMTCAIPFDLASQRARFPEIEWLPYDAAAREQAIAACDSWVGVGGSPFQCDLGTWFIDHLLDEQRLCRRHGKRMFFLGVGVNTPRDVTHEQTKQIVRAAEAIWTRDPVSAELLGAIGGASVTAGNDLSHAYLSGMIFGPPVGHGTGFVLNFEEPQQVSTVALAAVVSRAPRPVWLAQEVRELPGSELALYATLPTELRSRVPLRVPDYAGGSLPAVLGAWGTPGTLVTSRYHATILAAWAGWKVVSIERGTKVSAIARAIGTVTVKDFTDAALVLDAIDRAQAARREVLVEMATDARAGCAALFGTL
jgi:polysaccharide pyruvyl transferase WcaK-like protein